MREVKVKRAELLEKIKANRQKHVDEYVQAVAGYREMAAEKVNAAFTKAKAELDTHTSSVLASIKAMTPKDIEDGPGDNVILLNTIAFNLRVPVSHEKDYDQVVSMLEMSVDDELTIRSDEFACYVMDDWEWKKDFAHLNKTYSNYK